MNFSKNKKMQNKFPKQKELFFLLFVFSFLFFFKISDASAATYYACDCGAGADASCSVGNDLNVGTDISAPIRTLSAVATKFNALNAGDVIRLCKGGSFSSAGSMGLVNSKCRSGNQCTLTDYALSIQNPPTAKPKLNFAGAGIDFSESGSSEHEEGYVFSNLELIGNGGGTAFYFYNDIDNVTIDNLYIHDFASAVRNAGSQSATAGSGSDARNGGLILKNSTISNNSSAHTIYGAFSDFQILNNQFLNNAKGSTNRYSIFLDATLGYEVTNVVIKGNTISGTGYNVSTGNCDAPAIYAVGKINDLTIEGNTISEDIGKSNAGCTGIAMLASVQTPTDQIEYFKNVSIKGNKLYNLGTKSIDMNSCQNCTIENNEIVQKQAHYQQFGIIQVGVRGRGSVDLPFDALTIKNNSIYMGFDRSPHSNPDIGIQLGCDAYNSSGNCENTSTNNIITNNAIYYDGNNGTWSCFSLGLAASSYTAVNNNICYYPRDPNKDTKGWDVHYVGSSVTTSSFAGWKGSTSFDANSQNTNPLFKALVSPYSLAQLSSSSPMINIGSTAYFSPKDIIGVSRDALPDIGAYEYAPLAIAPTLPNGMVGTAYSQTVVLTGGITPYSTLAKISGTLPEGLTFTGATGILSGTPTKKGTFKFTISVTDSDTPSAVTVSQEITVIIISSLGITTTSFPSVFEGVSYSQTLSATGGLVPYSWDISSGTLPNGIHLDPNTGIISGTPVDAVTGLRNYPFTVRLTDDDSPKTIVTKDLSILVRESLKISNALVPDPRIGVPYRKQFSANGAMAPYIWSIESGTLPEGLQLDSSTGIVSGTPSSAGPFSYTIKVVDSDSPQNSATRDVSVVTKGTYESDYYVCDCEYGADGKCVSGDDNNDGLTPATAFKTYARAQRTFNGDTNPAHPLAPMQAGQTIAFCRGGSFTFEMVSKYASPRWINYNCRADQPCTIQDYTPTWADGTEGKPIVTQGGGDAFRFDNAGNSEHKEGYVMKNIELRGMGNGSTTTGYSGSSGVFIYNDTDDVLLDNLTVSGFDLGIYFGAANAKGATGDNENKRLILQNSNIFNNSGQGFGGSCSDCVVDHNNFTNNGYSRTILSHNIYWTGVQADRETTGGRITNNVLTQSGMVNGVCQATELVAHGRHSNLTIENNTIYEAPDKVNGYCFGIQATPGYDYGEYFHNLSVANNKIWNIGTVAIGVASCKDCFIENNEIVQEQNSALKLTTTGINIPDTGEVFPDEKSTNISVRNNSMYFNTTESNVGIKMGYNGITGGVVSNNTIYYTGNSSNFACFKYSSDSATITPSTFTGYNFINNNNCYSPKGLALGSGYWVMHASDAIRETSVDNAGILFTSRAAWTTASGAKNFDSNSTSVDPNFKSKTYPYDLSPASSAASGINQGNKTNSPTDDLLGIFRDSLPDLGAFEYVLPSITTQSIHDAIVNLPFFQTIFGEGGIKSFNWSFISGALPTGLTFDTNTQEIWGVPTVNGLFNFNLGLTDSNSPTATQVNKSFSILVGNSVNVSIATSSLPATIVNTQYSSTLSATGGQEPYIWEVTGGQFPLGLKLGSGGTITGMATQAGDFTFTISATESAYGSIASKEFTIAVDGPPLTIATNSLPNGLQGANYTAHLLTGGGKPVYQWAITSGSLPNGLTLQSDGTISGIPAQVGSSSFDVSVTDSKNATVSKTLSISINDPLLINDKIFPDALSKSAYSQTLSANNGTAPYHWAVTNGTLPLGLTLSDGGVLSGTPTESGTFPFTVSVTETSWNQVASKNFSIIVMNPVSITTSIFPNAQNGSVYSQALSATGGLAPYAWSLGGGKLPTGLSLSSAGLISGTVAESGTFAFTVTATESSYNQSISKNIYIVVVGEVAISRNTLKDATQYSSYAVALPATGGTAPYSWSLVSGSIPAGLVLSDDGAIGGTPTEAGTFSFTLSATEASYSKVDTKELNLKILPGTQTDGGIKIVEKIVEKKVEVQKDCKKETIIKEAACPSVLEKISNTLTNNNDSSSNDKQDSEKTNPSEKVTLVPNDPVVNNSWATYLAISVVAVSLIVIAFAVIK
jgi:hypothetical protein